MKPALVLAAALLGLHAILLELALRWDFASALLSPGSHSAVAALMLAVTLVSARLACLVLLPGLLLGALTFQALSLVRGRNRPR